MKNYELHNNGPVKIYALGGLGEVGKNLYCFEDDESIIMVDCGVMFPNDDLPGINYVIPDMSYLIRNQHKVKALIITHGHEDHIGSIPFLLQLMPLRAIYASKLALSLIRTKLSFYNFKNLETALLEYNEKTQLKIGDFTIEFFHVTHSIPDSYGIVLKTSQGTIITTGDFKIDLTPVDYDFNLPKLVGYGNEGVDLLLADSTNAEREGYTPSEKSVISSINKAFKNAKGRIIVSTFSSNISRVSSIIATALKFKRKIAILGRSMENNITIARDYGYIKLPESSLITPEDASNLKKNEVCIICTGSQGEVNAALTKIVNNDLAQVKLIPGDTVVFSSSPIPGNTQSINNLVNLFFKKGANVIVNSPTNALHASGHPCKQELRLMQKLVRPKYFMPVHGEYRMLKQHADIAVECGCPRENTFVLSNGDVLELYNHKVTLSDEKIPSDALYLDGNNANGLQTSVIKDRNILSNQGCIIVILSIDSIENKVISEPKIIAKGFLKLSPYLTEKASKVALDAVNSVFNKNKVTYFLIKESIKTEVGKFFFQETSHNPMIVPLILTKISPLKTDASAILEKSASLEKISQELFKSTNKNDNNNK